MSQAIHGFGFLRHNRYMLLLKYVALSYNYLCICVSLPILPSPKSSRRGTDSYPFYHPHLAGAGTITDIKYVCWKKKKSVWIGIYDPKLLCNIHFPLWKNNFLVTKKSILFYSSLYHPLFPSKVLSLFNRTIASNFIFMFSNYSISNNLFWSVFH